MPASTFAAIVGPMSTDYVLKYDEEEIKRLKYQAEYHADDRLDVLVRKAKRILDLGCGPGTLVERIRKINPTCTYLGLDADEKAIQSARAPDSKVEFRQVDITKLPLKDVAQDFDLIICRLVLWALAKVDAAFIRGLTAHLSTGGILYAFEPDDQNLTFAPDKKALDEISLKWEKAVIAKGQNPYIGRRLFSFFVEAGLKEIDVKPMTFTETSANPDAYRKLMKNLKAIYSSLNEDDPALEEFDRVSPGDLVVEHHFSVFGTK
jgi:SAM-dependent methyltransferase